MFHKLYHEERRGEYWQILLHSSVIFLDQSCHRLVEKEEDCLFSYVVFFLFLMRCLAVRQWECCKMHLSKISISLCL
jgi:hypothetical protein